MSYINTEIEKFNRNYPKKSRNIDIAIVTLMKIGKIIIRDDEYGCRYVIEGGKFYYPVETVNITLHDVDEKFEDQE